MDWKKVLDKPTIIAAAILLLGAIGLQATILSQGWSLFKKPLDLQNPFYAFPKEFGRYKMPEKGNIELSHETLSELNAKDYFQRIYIDSRTKNPSDPQNAIRAHAAYFTGLPDSKPHVSNHFFVTGGAGKTTLVAEQTLDVDNLKIPIRIYHYVDVADPSVTFHIIITHIANNQWFADTNQVENAVADLSLTHTYWCRLELALGKPTVVTSETLQKQAAQQATDFLKDFIPQLKNSLPIWPIK